MKIEDIKSLVANCEKDLVAQFKMIDDNCLYHSEKVLNAFRECGVNNAAFGGSTGYAFYDYGRDVIEKIYAKIFNAEDAIVRTQFVSGSHTLNVTLFALLRPGDLLLSITGTPYDTLHEVIGIKENASSLKSFGVNYDQIDLINNDFDYEKIRDYLANNNVKVVHIQRSKGYSTRESLTIDKVRDVIKTIREVNQDAIIMVDNCYCEMVEKVNPIEVGADVVVGSLIKNLGGGIAPNGGYVVGKTEYINLVGERLTLPGEGRDIGPTLGFNKSFLQGLFFAPSVVASALKTAVLTSEVMNKLGYQVSPASSDIRADIVQNIIFNDPDKLIKYVGGIQNASPIDSTATPIPCDIAGYPDQVIMAAGSFTEGSTIELSCDGPMRAPYIAYQQGGLSYEYGKLGLITAIDYLLNK